MSILSQGFLHNLCPCFDIAFAQLGATPRTRNRFDEILAVAECYLISNHVKNKESKKQPFQICLPVKLADGRMFMKKGKKTSFYLIYNISIWATWLENPFHDDKLNINL